MDYPKSGFISRQKAEFFKSVTQRAIDDSRHENCSTQSMSSSSFSSSSNKGERVGEKERGMKRVEEEEERNDGEKRQGCEKLTGKEEEELSRREKSCSKLEEREEKERREEDIPDTHTNELMMDEERMRKQNSSPSLDTSLPLSSPSLPLPHFSPSLPHSSQTPLTTVRSSPCQVFNSSNNSLPVTNQSSLTNTNQPITNPNTLVTNPITNPNPAVTNPITSKKPPIPPTSPSIQERRRQLLEKKLASQGKLGSVPIVSEEEHNEQNERVINEQNERVISEQNERVISEQNEREISENSSCSLINKTVTNDDPLSNSIVPIMDHPYMIHPSSSSSDFQNLPYTVAPPFDRHNLINPYGGSGFNPCSAFTVDNYVNYGMVPTQQSFDPNSLDRNST